MSKRILGLGLLLAAVSVSWLAQARPDLIVSSLEVLPRVPTPGAVVALVAIVENAGDTEIGSSFFVRFEVDDQEIDTVSVPAGLAPRASREVSTSWVAEEGPHVLSAEADQPFNRVSESRETNNFESITVFVPFGSTFSGSSPALRVAVMGFADLSGSAFVNVGDGVADKLSGRLAEAGLAVVERGELESILQQGNLDPSASANLVSAARTLGVDRLVIGSIDSIDLAEATLNLGIVRFSSVTIGIHATATLIDVHSGAVVSSAFADSHEEGASGISVNLGGFISLSKDYDVCGGGLRTDGSSYTVGETVPIGYDNPGGPGWFSVEIYTAVGDFLDWLGWRFIGTGQCGRWLWSQRDSVGSQVSPGLYRAKLWDGTSYVAVTSFQIHPGWNTAFPPIDQITVGAGPFDKTIAGSAVGEIVAQLASSLLSSIADSAQGIALSRSEAEAAAGAAAPVPDAASPRVGQVAAILPDGRVAINIGSSSGVAVGDRFEILAAEDLVFDPVTLEILDFTVRKRQGEIQIVEVRERVAYGLRTASFEPSIGDVARRIGS